MRQSKDLTGRVFTRLTVLAKVRRDKKIYYQCLCQCGKETIVYGSKLRRGSTKSCGCYGREQAAARLTTHGMRQSRVYKIWWRMVTRVTNPNDADYPRYSKLGIAEEWKKFEGFYADMGDVPDGLSIERVDNEVGYFPGNCVWATTFVQSINRRNTIKITWQGETKPLLVWSKQLGLSYDRTYRRYKAGMTPDKILSKEPLKRERK
jgi:hypothetical protein